jgi:hypothetical protein
MPACLIRAATELQDPSLDLGRVASSVYSDERLQGSHPQGESTELIIVVSMALVGRAWSARLHLRELERATRRRRDLIQPDFTPIVGVRT